MLTTVLHRVLLTVPILFGVSVIVFLVISLVPGDPALAILGPYATPENVLRVERELGLDRSLPSQYVHWFSGVLTGDLGRSYALNRPVAAELGDRLPPTVLLAGTALILCSLFGLLAGTVAAVRQYGWTDRFVTLVVLVGISTPSFFLGIVLILFFAVRLGWLPTGGMSDLFGGGGPLDIARHLLLPAVTLALVGTGVVARFTRTTMLEVLRQDHVRTARAKGLREPAVIGRHAFRNALVDVIPVIGTQAGFVLGGAVYIETVFQWPGIGRMLVDAIRARDILLVQGGVLVVAAIYVLINLLADLAQAALDPRLRVG